MVCPVCHQPECPESRGGSRPPAGCLPSRLDVGEREYRGYEEWALHPSEASFLLHQGFVLVDGQPAQVQFIHNEAYVTQVRVYGSDPLYSLAAVYYAASAREPERAAV